MILQMVEFGIFLLIFWRNMINFFKKLFKMQREVYMVDSNNLAATLLTRDYPENRWLFLTSIKNNSKVVLAVDSYIKNGNTYNIQTPKGHFVIQYK